MGLRISFIAIVLFSFVTIAVAQDRRNARFGSPDAVDNQLATDAEEEDALIEFELFNPYFDFKSRLQKDLELTFGIDYTHVYVSASNTLPRAEDDAAGGMVRFFGSWDLVGRESGNTGALVWKGEHRHRSTEVAPKDLSFQTGYAGIYDAPFSDEQFRVTNLYWRQRFKEPRMTFMAGFLDVTDYLDAFGLGSPWLHFQNLAFSTGSAAIDLPNDATLGVAGSGMITDNLYIIASITNAVSDATKPFDGFDSAGDEEYFKSVEIGWTTSPDRIVLDNVHLTFWHTDDRESLGTPDGWGVNFSASYFVADEWMPFIRGGYTDESGSLLERSVSVGVGYQPQEHRNRNLIAVAANWGRANPESFGNDDDQYALELFYRLQLTREIALTPNVQLIVDPALNPDDDSIWVGGIRGRLAL